MKKLLALDQSSQITGYAIFYDDKLIKYGTISIKDSNLEIRLMKLRKKIESLINDYEINEVYLEDIQLQNNVANNVQTFKALAEVIGVITELLAEINIDYKLILSSTWKSALSIKGRVRAEQKKNAQQFVFDNYNKKVTSDEADAICIGTYAIQSQIEEYDWS